MNSKWQLDRFVIVGVALLLMFPSVIRKVTGGDIRGGDGSARSTWQRVLDTPSPGSSGTLELSKKGDKQSFSLLIRDLPGDSMGLFFGTNITTGTNTVWLIAPIQRRGSNTWAADYKSDNGSAPFPLPFDDLEDMEGLYLFIGTPAGETNVTDCVTNITDCVTNIVDDTTNVTDCVTNITDCVTNIFYDTFLFTQVPMLTDSASDFNSKERDDLDLGEFEPSPKAKGTLLVKFDAKKGRSLFCIRATKLLAGQVYSLWMSLSPGGIVETNIGEMAETGKTGRTFKRDTKRGETLPELAGTVTNLYGFNFEIRDEFGFVHLQGTVPGFVFPEPD